MCIQVHLNGQLLSCQREEGAGLCHHPLQAAGIGAIGACQLLAFVKGIEPGMCFSLVYELLELRTACKSTPSNVKQGRWDADFLQRDALKKGFLLNDAQVSGKAELLLL